MHSLRDAFRMHTRQPTQVSKGANSVIAVNREDIIYCFRSLFRTSALASNNLFAAYSYDTVLKRVRRG